MLADYDELKAGIADLLMRDDLVAQIPTFIRLAEARIDRELRHFRQEVRSNATLTGRYSAIPYDYLQPIRMEILDGVPTEVTPMSLAGAQAFRDQRSGMVGRPTNYALTDGTFELYPTPDAGYEMSLLYYGRLPRLGASDPSNWLLQEAPDAYLYGAAVHSAPFLKDDERIQVWEAFYKLSIDGMNTASEDAKWAGTGLKITSRRGAP